MTDKFKVAFEVTAWFETSGQLYTLSVGNFDKQGCSWGPRQTNIGQSSLQPLMRKMLEDDPLNVQEALGDLYYSFVDVARVQPTSDQLAIVIRDWNDDRGRLKTDWRNAFRRLGELPSVQKIFQDDARTSIPSTDRLAAWIASGPTPTVREWCLAYDFVTQNGGFHSAFRAAISTFLFTLKAFRKDPRDRMRAICWLRAGWTYIRGQRKFADDVLGRKLLIVEGASKFRGSWVDLDEKYGVSDGVV